MKTLIRIASVPTIALSVALLPGCARPADDGRVGNRHYQEGKYDEAVAAFQDGLNRFESDEPSPVRSDLLNNQGAAYYRTENPEAAQDAFINSVAMADSRAAQARGSYNAGNAAYSTGSKQLAADFYRQTLLLDPDNEDARFNYEFVKRQLEQEQQDDQGGGSEPPPKPSDFAVRLKAEADELVARHEYRQANLLMLDGLRIDPTVKAFQTFIDRTGSVADINESGIHESATDDFGDNGSTTSGSTIQTI